VFVAAICVRTRFEPGLEPQSGAEFFDCIVFGEARRINGNLEKDVTREYSLRLRLPSVGLVISFFSSSSSLTDATLSRYVQSLHGRAGKGRQRLEGQNR